MTGPLWLSIKISKTCRSIAIQNCSIEWRGVDNFSLKNYHSLTNICIALYCDNYIALTYYAVVKLYVIYSYFNERCRMKKAKSQDLKVVWDFYGMAINFNPYYLAVLALSFHPTTLIEIAVYYPFAVSRYSALLEQESEKKNPMAHNNI